MRTRIVVLAMMVAASVLAIAPASSSAAMQSCKGVPVMKISGLKQAGTRCGDARATAREWHHECEDISDAFFCDPKSLQYYTPGKRYIAARGYKCFARELYRTANKAKHRIKCAKNGGRKRVTFVHLTTRTS